MYEQSDYSTDKNKPVVDTLGPLSQTLYAFYDPYGHKELKLRLHINKNDPDFYSQRDKAKDHEFVVSKSINFNAVRPFKDEIEYDDQEKENKKIIVSVTNNGRTRTLRIAK